MHEIEIILGLLFVVAALSVVAQRLAVPYPILLVLGGLVLGFIPGLPNVELDPELVFLLFLPPLLTSAAWFTSWRDFRFNLRPILLLAIGLVLVTTSAVAVVAHGAIAGLTWPVAFVLGAIVSPPDAVAATAITERLNIPRRVVTVLEGESLINDATGFDCLPLRGCCDCHRYVLDLGGKLAIPPNMCCRWGADRIGDGMARRLGPPSSG